ncbi:FMN-binding negative transcriptional regulator [Pedobacter sp. AW1-32]|uniref:FMN-binding negative transcriptional regulator n=1 Tax=Pedobacter sp. AW1-32 TaxID=3383026 RepID=UPI003FEFBD24
MYNLPRYATAGRAEIIEFMHTHDFVTLIGFDGEYPVATQIPVEVVVSDDQIKLIGHIMANTDHCSAFKQNANVLAIFTGVNAYISASVYEQPAVASTWNYKTVQAKGQIRLMSSEETYLVIKNLTDKYENPQTSKAAFRQMDEACIQKHLKAITGFEIDVTNLAHTFKLSQNQSAENQRQIIANLEKSGRRNDQDLAKEMKKNL